MIEQKITFCRICEPFCGMVASVENNKLLSLRPDPKHPLSKGFACPKGIAYAGVQNDPDRVLYPLKRQADGSFVRVSWDSAMADIISRLGKIINTHGGESVAWYGGNPATLNYSHSLWLLGFLKAIGTPHFFGPGSQDTNSRMVASQLLYGSLLAVPVPDLDASEMVIILGANPAVSHGSLACIPHFMGKLHEVVKRGGEVVVIDPRRTETAREFAWTPITPDSDAWLLLSLLQVMFDDNLVDESLLRKQATGIDALKQAVQPFPPEQTATKTGISAAQVRELARGLALKRAVLYGRLGTCLGSSATLVNYLLDAVNLVAGNLDRPGGSVFGDSPLPLAELAGSLATYDSRRSRIGNLPEVFGMEPSANMAAEITTAGRGQIRAMFVSGGNPVISTPGGLKLGSALDQLDLMVSLDLYITETNSHADYVLPATAMYERDDIALYSLGQYVTPFIQATEAVVTPPGEARPEWQVIDQLARGLGTRALPLYAARQAAKLADIAGIRLTPRLAVDSLIRIGRVGDLWGVRKGGVNFDTLTSQHPHGILLADRPTVGQLRKVVRHKGGKAQLDHAAIWSELRRLTLRSTDADYPLFLIGMRELRSENSWMHNVPSLRAARPQHAARMHPLDAAELRLINHGPVRLVTPWGAITLPVLITEDISRGVVAVPHGWGHRGKGNWKTANHEGGASVNDLMTTDAADLDPLSGMSHLNGVRIRAERIIAPTTPASDRPKTAGATV
jgi:formate dehydrogenase